MDLPLGEADAQSEEPRASVIRLHVRDGWQHGRPAVFSILSARHGLGRARSSGGRRRRTGRALFAISDLPERARASHKSGFGAARLPGVITRADAPMFDAALPNMVDFTTRQLDGEAATLVTYELQSESFSATLGHTLTSRPEQLTYCITFSKLHTCACKTEFKTARLTRAGPSSSTARASRGDKAPAPARMARQQSGGIAAFEQ
jgi:hypothetical protein